MQEYIVLAESLQTRSEPLHDAVVVTGELPGKGVTCKVRKDGEAGQLFAQQVSSPLIMLLPSAPSAGGTSLVNEVSKPPSTSLCRCSPSRLSQVRSAQSCHWT